MPEKIEPREQIARRLIGRFIGSENDIGSPEQILADEVAGPAWLAVADECIAMQSEARKLIERAAKIVASLRSSLAIHYERATGDILGAPKNSLSGDAVELHRDLRAYLARTEGESKVAGVGAGPVRGDQAGGEGADTPAGRSIPVRNLTAAEPALPATPDPSPYRERARKLYRQVVDLYFAGSNASQLMDSIEAALAEVAAEQRAADKIAHFDWFMSFCDGLADEMAKDGKPASAASIKSAVAQARAAIREGRK